MHASSLNLSDAMHVPCSQFYNFDKKELFKSTIVKEEDFINICSLDLSQAMVHQAQVSKIQSNLGFGIFSVSRKNIPKPKLFQNRGFTNFYSFHSVY